MKLLALVIPMLIAGEGAHACSLFDPCKPAMHHIQKAKTSPAVAKHENRIADLERRLLLAEAMLAAHEAALGAQQHQLSRLAPK